MRHLLVLVPFVVLTAACGNRVYCQGSQCTGDAGQQQDSGAAPCNNACSGFLPVCDATRNVCVACGGGLGCSGLSPVCDEGAANGNGACVVCTSTEGCSGATPHCLVDGSGRRCVACRSNADCPATERCDSATHACVPRVTDGGMTEQDAGPGDAGSTEDGGVDGGNSWDGGACIVRPTPTPCTMECDPGFNCQSGQCVLNGGNGPVQVTLRWNTAEDVDLHVIEPVPGGAACDVYYGNADGTLCGAVGVLDLDSNAGCNIDNVDIENVIYATDAGAPSGTWAVLVDHYSNCDPMTTYVPYEVEVRVGTTIMGYCGAFTANGPGWDNGGGANAGTQVMTFIVP
ncbi:MAG: hypothetical protein IT380_01525 [Myxococcales bacterium]|nr:hypothetical protein [Myxococcales bacterium]